MSRRRRILVFVVAALAALQLAVVLGLKWRSSNSDGEERIYAAAVQPPPLVGDLVVDNRTRRVALQSLAPPMIVHVWATWCKPCREELPELIEAIPMLNKRGVAVVLASVDESWPVIDHYFEGETPAQVVRVTHEDARSILGVEAMPTSLTVGSDGRLGYRLPGIQPWGSLTAREQMLALLAK